MKARLFIWGTRLIWIVILMLMSGCWSKVEINKRTFVTGIFIDKSDIPGQVEVTISTPLPNRLISGEARGPGGNKGNPFAVISKSGRTITDAVNAIQLDLTRDLSWGHTRVVVIGKEYAQDGIDSLLAWTNREPLFHLSSYLLVAPGKAKDVTKLTPVYEKSPTEVLTDFSTAGKLMDTDVRTFSMSVLAKQDDAVTELVMGEIPLISEKGKTAEWAGIKGAAIFSNKKMVGSLNIEQARAIAWARGRLRRMDMTIENDEKVSATILNLKSSITPVMSAGEPVFIINLGGSAELNSISPLSKGYSKQKSREVKQAMDGKIKADLSKAIDFAMDNSADILHFGYHLEWRYPTVWERLRPEWRKYVHTKLRYEIHPDIKLEYFGSQSGGPT
ncbi:Ger(x)C family spore germination protein [Paenibacillus sp. XY044]|uniref:Ger(x)C family spore germination protein n=1 Tax=Paenibacillus sp. XY044 TaxID=2026089 RepID=UPI000B984DEA|nr:Ger(x)C family spore germination protein [Paenibacillus sp. XY044]OZB94935.1 hypothetical protein CJP46_14570 [Paenibacillus sp. XY044]